MIGSLFSFSWHLMLEAVWAGLLVLLWVWLLSNVDTWFPKLEGHPWVVLVITGLPVFFLGPDLLLTFLWISFFIALTCADDVRRVLLLPHFKWMKKWQADLIFYSLVFAIFISLRQLALTSTG